MDIKSRWPWVPVLVVLAFYASLVVHFYHQWRPLSLDFQTRYFAGKAAKDGLDPYAARSIRLEGAMPHTTRFIQAPQTMWFNRVLALFRMKTSYTLLLVFKLVVLAALFVIWARVFLREEFTPWFIPFALLAFNSAIFIDLSVGNLAILEEFCIWVGFWFLLRNRLLLFCLPIIFIANFKVAPAIFLLLLLVIDHKKKYAYFFGSALVLALIQVLAYWRWPVHYRDFLLSGQWLVERHRDPTSSSLVWRFFAGENLRFDPRWRLPCEALAGLIVIAVLYVSGRTVKKLRALPGLSTRDRYRLLIFFACLAYALVVPRFTSYSQIILIVPAWFALRKFLRGTEGILFFILVALQPAGRASMPGLHSVFGIVWSFGPLFIAFGLWLLFIFRIDRSGKTGVGLLAQTDEAA